MCVWGGGGGAISEAGGGYSGLTPVPALLDIRAMARFLPKDFQPKCKGKLLSRGMMEQIYSPISFLINLKSTTMSVVKTKSNPIIFPSEDVLITSRDVVLLLLFYWFKNTIHIFILKYFISR